MSSDPKTIAATLRKLHAARTRHFTSPSGVPAFSIVATEQLLATLKHAADAMERLADDAALLDLGLICVDGRDELGNDAVSVHCGLDTRQAIRKAVEHVAGDEGPPVLLHQAVKA